MSQVFRHETTNSTVLNVVCVILNTFVRAGIYYRLSVEGRGKTEIEYCREENTLQCNKWISSSEYEVSKNRNVSVLSLEIHSY